MKPTMTSRRVTAFRQRMALSQAQLGALLGVPEQTVWRWEQRGGKQARQPPPYLSLALAWLEYEHITRPSEWLPRA